MLSAVPMTAGSSAHPTHTKYEDDAVHTFDLNRQKTETAKMMSHLKNLRKLTQEREEKVRVEDRGMWAGRRKLLQRLGHADTEEHTSRKDTIERGLQVRGALTCYFCLKSVSGPSVLSLLIGICV
jgi:hypothetical protein